MAILPVGEWLPDLPDFGNPGASTIQNCVPLTKESYGPMPTPQVYSGALTARCQGAYAFLDDSGGVHIYAGDATKLYELTAGSAPAFSDVSRLVGGAYTTGSPVHPLFPTAPSWNMTSFGNRIIATNYADAIQSFIVGSSTNFAALAAAAPKARFAAVIRDFLMVGNTTDASFGTQTRRLWWPAISDPTNWPTPGSATAISLQSDYQDLEQSDLGQITGLIGGHLSAADGAAFCERGIYRIQYVGSAGGIFAFQVAEGAAGTQAPLSIVRRRLNGNVAVAYYLSDEGFRAFDGMQSIAFGDQKFDRTVINDIDPTMGSMVFGGAVPNLPLVYWLYTSKSGAGSLLYDKMVIYNTNIGRGSLIDLSATPAEWGLVAMGTGFTLDALDAFGTLDTLPAPLDSNYWQGGAPVLAAFNSSHKLNFVNGPAMAPIVETSEVQPTPSKRSRIRSARPLVLGGGTPSISIGVRDRLTDSVVYKTAVAMNRFGECPQRYTGRYVRARMTLAAADTWTHLQGVELDTIPEGRR
jgi:hypothetical protein